MFQIPKINMVNVYLTFSINILSFEKLTYLNNHFFEFTIIIHKTTFSVKNKFLNKCFYFYLAEFKAFFMYSTSATVK